MKLDKLFGEALRKLDKKRKQAGIPPVPKNADPESRQFFEAVRENLAVRMGQEGDPLEQAVTFKDFAKAGMLNWSGGVGLPGSGGGPNITPGTPDFDYSPPPAPTNLTASGGFDMIFLDWDHPRLLYNYYAEVWRSPVDILDLESVDMKFIGTANSPMYIDHLNGDRTVYYYWVRYVKAIGSQLIFGPFNATAGTSAQITLDPDYVIDLLQGQIGESELANELLTPIQSIPTIQQTLDDHGIRIPTLEDTVGDHAVLIPSMQDILDDFSPRIDAAEGSIIDHEQDITNLQASIQLVNDDLVANASAISGLDTRVIANEQDISAQAGQITALQATLNDINIGPFDVNATYLVGALFRYNSVVYEVIASQTPPNATPPNAVYYTPQPDYQSIADAVSANAAAVNSLDSRVTLAEGELTSQASDITLLQSDLALAEGDISGNASAISSLGTRVTATENGITSLSGDLTTLENSLATTNGNVTANANAISSLQTEISDLDGVVTSQSTDITQLQSGLSSAEGDITLNSGAISSLETRVTSAEGTIGSQSTALTNLSDDLSTLDGEVTANAGALTLLDNRVTSAEGTITSQGSAITQLQNDLQTLDVDGNAAAINSLTTRVEDVEGDVSATAQSLTQLEATVDGQTAAIQTKASVTALQGVEDDVATLSAQYTVKLDVNGRVAGIGLANNNGVTEFVVASDAVYFIDPGQSITAFNPDTNYTSMAALRNTQFVFGYAQVEGQRRFAINVPAYIPEATITNAMIKDATITGAKIANATIGGAKIDIADIWDLSIGNEIKSDSFVAGQSGWRIAKDGFAEFGNGTFRGHVEMDTGYISESVQIGGVPQYSNFLSGNFIRSGAHITSSTAMTNEELLKDGIRAISSNYWSLSSGIQYVQATFSTERYISENRMFFYALDGRRYKYAIAVSMDGITWQYIIGSGPTNGGTPTGFVWSRSATGGYNAGYEFPTITPIGKFARYIRVWMNGSSVNTGNHGYEWEVYGAGGGGDDPYVASIGSGSKDAVDLVNAWVRPSSTYIKGSAIYSGDVYVDTVNIRGQAVTFPRGALTTSTLSVGTSWATVQSVSMALTGAPIIITGSFAVRKTSGSSGDSASVRILVGGSPVFPEQIVARGTQSGMDSQFMPEYSMDGSPAISHFVQSPGSGTKTIAIQCRCSSGTFSCSNRSISVIEAKR